MKPYGHLQDRFISGRWTITNGHVSFDVHFTIDGSIDKEPARIAAERRGEPTNSDHFIVTPKEADAYAKAILETLNAHPVSFAKRYRDNINND